MKKSSDVNYHAQKQVLNLFDSSLQQHAKTFRTVEDDILSAAFGIKDAMFHPLFRLALVRLSNRRQFSKV